MSRQVAIGVQDFAKLIENNSFYVDKTTFIRDWWNSGDDVTLITRPRRFGKTITLNMLDYFFSDKYAGRSNLFEGLDIWKDEKFRKLHGTYPVIFLDEYDTPLQEAYIRGYWDDMTAFIRTMFNNTFKTNPSMERAIMTGKTFPILRIMLLDRLKKNSMRQS